MLLAGVAQIARTVSDFAGASRVWQLSRDIVDTSLCREVGHVEGAARHQCRRAGGTQQKQGRPRLRNGQSSCGVHDLAHPQPTRLRAGPHKRPHSAWKRFQAELPNQCWQADLTHWRLADHTEMEIVDLIDDHSRVAIASHATITTGPDVVDTVDAPLAYWGTRSCVNISTTGCTSAAAVSGSVPGSFTAISSLRSAATPGARIVWCAVGLEIRGTHVAGTGPLQVGVTG